jgi:hypothetical protein
VGTAVFATAGMTLTRATTLACKREVARQAAWGYETEVVQGAGAGFPSTRTW